MTLPHALGIFARGHRRRHDQHRRGQRHPVHLSGAARLRLRAGHRQRVQHCRPGSGVGGRRDRLPRRAERPAPARDAAGRRRRCSAASSAPILLLSLPAVGVQGDRPRIHRDRARADRAPAAPGASARRHRGAPGVTTAPARSATAATFGSGIYGGYFGAAQGILLLAILGLSLDGGPPADQRAQGRAGRPGQPGGGRWCSCSPRTSPGWRRC